MLNVDVAKMNKQAARCACEWVVSILERVAIHVTRVALGVLHARLLEPYSCSAKCSCRGHCPLQRAPIVQCS